MSISLTALPYAYDALEPYIDARTMEIHHSKHHQGYITKLNNALENYPELAAQTTEELLANFAGLPDSVRQPVINNGGGHANHSLFWSIMAPGGSGEPGDKIGAAIDKTFGGFDAFKEKFSDAAATRFGSGWAWLIQDKKGQLQVISTANQDNPIMEGNKPILGLDVWEHAYYLKYQNRRPDYITAWWNVVNWDAVNEIYKAAN